MDVPTEVWLEIFSTLERHHLIPLYRVSRTLHRISRPLLLRHFAFHPYAAINGDETSDDFLIPREVEFHYAMQRFRFWASDNVAPLVRECTIAPWNIAYEERYRYVSCYDGGDILLQIFFELLPRFTSLAKLSALYVRFNQLSIDAICSLPNLEEIELGKCPVDEGVTICPHSNVTRLKFLDKGPSHSYKEALGGVQGWSSIVNPQTLTHLSLLPLCAITAFLDINGAEFPNVESLDVCIYSWNSDIVALHRFPAVRRLHLSTDVLGSPPQAAALFPLLDTYRGPPGFLLLLDARAAPRQLEIDGCMPQRLSQTLRSCVHVLRRVTALGLSFLCLPLGAFRPIVESFPALVHFCLEVQVNSIGFKFQGIQLVECTRHRHSI
ncbi:hypothetical protein C8R45DRAFT_83395 [Mycena sanguinolenta]|nr:hypothetical protein C8R45DRAFT_83395 [Mycena sanguinolenta]